MPNLGPPGKEPGTYWYLRQMMLEQLTKTTNAWLAGSPSLNLLFLILAIVSLMASIYFFAKSKKEKQPVYMMEEFPLIQDKLAAVEGLSIAFNGREISNLFLTKVAIWNKGRETMNRSDIAAADRLRIELKNGGAILGAKVSFVRRKVNGLSVSVEDCSAFIDFDFLDHLDGAVIDIYHSKPCVMIKGTLKGAVGIRPGAMEEDALLDKFLDPIVNRLPDTKSKTIEKMFILALVPLCLPVAAPLMLIERLVRIVQVVPKEYSLKG